MGSKLIASKTNLEACFYDILHIKGANLHRK